MTANEQKKTIEKLPTPAEAFMRYYVRTEFAMKLLAHHCKTHIEEQTHEH